MTTEGTLQGKEEAAKIPDNDALVEEMLREAKGIELPSELTKNPVLHRGDSDLPAPVTVHEIRSALYFYIWDTQTGEKVPCLGYMLAQKLRQRLPNGKFRFTTKDPGIRPKRGTIKCLLHPDDPNRKEYDNLGFGTCRKSNLTNPYQLEQHMRRRHPQEWKTIESARKKARDDEDRDLQRAVLEQLKPKQETPAAKADNKEESEGFPCPTCGKTFKYKGKAYRKHVKNCKA
jgi:predicted RNA-binding Zn-ribbon protein involved in translation (DUF1610 family)